MKFQVLSTVLAASALASAAKYKIDSFVEEKDFTSGNILSVHFSVKATNGGTLDLACDSGKDAFKPDYRYSCSNSQSFSFEFKPRSGTQTNQLTLWQKVEGVWKQGVTKFDDPNACASGGGNRQICQWPKDKQDITIEVAGA